MAKAPISIACSEEQPVGLQQWGGKTDWTDSVILQKTQNDVETWVVLDL